MIKMALQTEEENKIIKIFGFLPYTSHVNEFQIDQRSRRENKPIKVQE